MMLMVAFMSDFSTYSNEQIQALKEALIKGVRTVSYGDRSVTYSSMDEMIRLLNYMIRTREKRTTRVPATFSKGL